MPVKLLMCLALLATAACSGSPFSAQRVGEDLVVRSGTSFGECVGYCKHEIEIGPTEIVVTESSWAPGVLPSRITRFPIEPAEWSEIQSLVAQNSLSGLEEIYGCPDCADGGAEWIEVQTGDDSRKVTFNYGSEDVPRVQPLVDKLREIRDRYKQPNP